MRFVLMFDIRHYYTLILGRDATANDPRTWKLPSVVRVGKNSKNVGVA